MKGFKTKVIVLVSPDGGGKTSAIHELRALISDRYHIHDRHIRFNNIPRIGYLLYKLKNPLKGDAPFIPSTSNLGKEIKKHTYGEAIPLWKIVIILSYELLDYLLGYVSLITKRGNHIFIFDRYIYDYYTERDWNNTPRWLMRLIMSIIPRPLLIINLKNDPEVIHKRKPELSVSDIAYTQDRIECLLQGDPNLIELCTVIPPKEIAKCIEKHIE